MTDKFDILLLIEHSFLFLTLLCSSILQTKPTSIKPTEHQLDILLTAFGAMVITPTFKSPSDSGANQSWTTSHRQVVNHGCKDKPSQQYTDHQYVCFIKKICNKLIREEVEVVSNLNTIFS